MGFAHRACRWSCAALVSGIATSAVPAYAAGVFASAVSSYDPGPAATADPFLSQFAHFPESALGGPDRLTGERQAGFPNVLNPFSPAYESDEVAVVGEGGYLRLVLPAYVNVKSGLQLGVFTNAGLQDSSFVNGSAPGTNYSPARGFGGGSARVAVSEDGVTYVPLGTFTFNAPTNFYTNLTDPYATAVNFDGVVSDFGQPFAGSLSDFDSKDFAQTIATFNGSAGGTWLDVSASGLGRVGFIEFAVDDTTPGIDRLAIDAVGIANGSVGAIFPEPGSLLALCLAPLILARRRPRPV